MLRGRISITLSSMVRGPFTAAILIALVASQATPTEAQTQVTAPPVAVTDTTIDDGATLVSSTPRSLTLRPPAPVPPQRRAAPRELAPPLPAGPLGIPGIAMKAYRAGADRVAQENPACRLPWYLLAGIGRIESNHAGNGSVDAAGTTLVPILGPVLDGSGSGDAVITDTDSGTLDGDATHDRAIGPMQFIPSTWKAWGADNNGDGIADPNNLFDAAYTAGRYLCAGVSDIMSVPRRVAAVLRYNQSLAYVEDVLRWALGYQHNAVVTTPIAGLPKPQPRPTPSTTPKPGASTTPSSPPAPTSRSTTPRCPQPCLADLPGLGFLRPPQPHTPPTTTPAR